MEHKQHKQLSGAHLLATFLVLLGLFVALTSFSPQAQAQTGKKKSVAKKSTSTKIQKSSQKRSVASASTAKSPAKPSSTAAQQLNQLRAPSNSAVADSDKTLEIRGQSRNLSMMLTLKNRHENIDFVRPRDSYRNEIKNTEF